MQKTLSVVFAVAAVLALAGCGPAKPTAVPDVVGQRLDIAQDTLDATGLRYTTIGGGTLGIVDRSHWIVCRQSPAPKALARAVTLLVARTCPLALPRVVPDVIDDQLDDARTQLEAAGFSVTARSIDGDPVLVEDRWTVCDQSPEPGHRGRVVELYVAHDCWDYS